MERLWNILDARDRHAVSLVEYQKAQDSAEHHDALVWNITSLNWVGSAVLMGFVLSGVDGHRTVTQKVALLSLVVTGILLTSLVWVWARQLRRVKVAKYERCIEIEEELGMKQHTSLKYRSGSQTRGYALLMTALLAAWASLAIVLVMN